MIEIDVPTIDPIQHQPKIVLGMNKRQLICVVPGLVIAVILGSWLSSYSIDLMIVGVLIGAAPAVAFGWLRPYNMPFENYLQLLITNFMNPQKRIYKTDNADDTKMLTIKEREALEKKKEQERLAQKKAQSQKKKNNGKEKPKIG